MTRELQAATDEHGHGSPEWASAQCDLGDVLLNADLLDRAVECYRRAVSAAPRDHGSRKDQLTYRLNLGLALRMAGRLDEAETELRQGVEERLAFYGREHAGYAFGLESLADLLRQRGDVAEARQVVEEAVANLWRNGHERVASALGAASGDCARRWHGRVALRGPAPTAGRGRRAGGASRHPDAGPRRSGVQFPAYLPGRRRGGAARPGPPGDAQRLVRAGEPRP
ncbi:tetratricopeptide repeat protein [Micromonospora sp. NBC_01412]|uniref:tetratricopeptide repeat protein n=1 Tax=Micromonospora sp. NBC_01412 TaxID=2903590 RepID=UPI0038672F02